MAEHPGDPEITSRIVNLGDRVIQLRHVVSVGRSVVHPLRPLGAVLAVLGVGLIGGEIAGRDAGASMVQAAASLSLWIGLVAAGVGLYLVFHGRRSLALHTSDGRRVELKAANEEAERALIQRIRYVMEAGSFGGSEGPVEQRAAAPAYGAGKTAMPSTARAGAPSGMPSHEAPSSAPPMGGAQGMGDAMGSRTMPAGRAATAYVNGQAGEGAFGPGGQFPMQPGSETGSLAEHAVQAYRRAGAGGGTLPPHQERTGGAERRPAADAGSALGAGREPLALPATFPTALAQGDGAQDLHALMEHVRGADVQHKEALLDLLRVVEDYYRGRGSREDAVAHWRSFADYVVQYLGDVDGLIAHTERFGRHMLGR
jgi:hypothetical protein